LGSRSLVVVAWASTRSTAVRGVLRAFFQFLHQPFLPNVANG
jgi:hypothetical protein